MVHSADRQVISAAVLCGILFVVDDDSSAPVPV
jgi:hypothetical protein